MLVTDVQITFLIVFTFMCQHTCQVHEQKCDLSLQVFSVALALEEKTGANHDTKCIFTVRYSIHRNIYTFICSSL